MAFGVFPTGGVTRGGRCAARAIRALILVGCAMAWHGGVALAADGEPPRDPITQLQEAVDGVNRLVHDRDYEAAATKLVEAERLVAGLSGEDAPPRLKRQLAPVQRRLRLLKRALQRHGVELPRPGETPDGKRAVLFSRDVAPILVGRCRRCHIDRSSGGLSMSTFDALARGSRKGPVIVPGSSRRSRLIMMLESGKMPRGGDKLAEKELATLRNWIDAGAKYDAKDRAAAIVQFAAGTSPPPTTTPAPKMVRPKGGETVSFRRDIAPVLVEHCVECHGATRPSGQLGLDRFARMLRGGNRGPVIEPGKPEESLIVKKLKGTAGQRMPLRRPPLSDKTIGRITTWITEGASFDGDDAGVPIERMVLLDRVRAMDHDELAALRAERSLEKWRLAVPDETAHRGESKHFLVLGDASDQTLQHLAELAETALDRLRPWLMIPPEARPLKGRLTLFVFRNGFDYTEFGRMVEQRAIPPSWPGHWKLDGIEAYACLKLPAAADDEALSGTMTELVAGAYLAGRGAPGWFAQGSARALRGKVWPKDLRVSDWKARLKSVSEKSDEFLKGGFAMDDSALLRFGLVDFLLTSPPRYRRLMTAFGDRGDFDTALVEAYGSSAAELVVLWRKQHASTARRR